MYITIIDRRLASYGQYWSVLAGRAVGDFPADDREIDLRVEDFVRKDREEIVGEQHEVGVFPYLD